MKFRAAAETEGILTEFRFSFGQMFAIMEKVTVIFLSEVSV